MTAATLSAPMALTTENSSSAAHNGQKPFYLPTIDYPRANVRGTKHWIRSYFLPGREFTKRKPELRQALLQAQAEAVVYLDTEALSEPEKMAESALKDKKFKSKRAERRANEYLVRKAHASQDNVAFSDQAAAFPAGKNLEYGDIGWAGPVLRLQEGAYQLPFAVDAADVKELEDDGVNIMGDGRNNVMEGKINLLGQGKIAEVRLLKNLAIAPDDKKATLNDRFKAIKMTVLEPIRRTDQREAIDAKQTNAETDIAITLELPLTDGFSKTRDAGWLRKGVSSGILPQHDTIFQAMDLGMGDMYDVWNEIRANVQGSELSGLKLNIALQCLHPVLLMHTNKNKKDGKPVPLFHGDIKLENFLLQMNGHINLSDFGTSSRGAEKTLEQQGSDGYRDPNLFFKWYKVNKEQVDAFALGALLYVLDHGEKHPKEISDASKASKVWGGHQDTAETCEQLRQHNKFADVARLLTQRNPKNRISVATAMVMLEQQRAQHPSGQSLEAVANKIRQIRARSRRA